MINITEIKPVDIITRIGNLTRTQAMGLNCLVFLAVREQTTVTCQHEEVGFDDIPEWIIGLCDWLDDDGLLDLAEQITIKVRSQPEE
ncbi:hypothetical protein [Nostoc sp.]|uniref:hypothetical protein n=1 Tax=Nostoc sp. TaxID=1180 RepID=UPI002FF994A7